MVNKKQGLHKHQKMVLDDNRNSNLEVLCALSQKHDSSHKGMYVSTSIEEFILRNRP